MTRLHKNLLPALLALLFITASAAPILAYDHDDKGWYDSHHHRHAFSHHNGHRGYWDHDNSGARIFISV